MRIFSSKAITSKGLKDFILQKLSDITLYSNDNSPFKPPSESKAIVINGTNALN